MIFGVTMRYDLSTFNRSRSEWERLIDEWIFNERDRTILKRKLLDGVSIERIAEEVDMSPRQAQRIIHRQSEKLFDKLAM